MPKKNKNKKSKASKKKTVAETKNSNSSSSPADVYEWQKFGRMDAKGLAQNLPDVAAGLRDGSVDPADVAAMACQATQDHLLSQLRKHLPEEIVKAGNVARLGGLETLTGAENLLCDLVRVACGADADLSFAFAWDFFGGQRKCPWANVREKIIMQGTTIVDCTPELYPEILDIHQAYNRACVKWRFSIEKLAKKPMEQHCWAYKESVVEFVPVLGQLIYRNENFSIEDICRDVAYTGAIEVDRKIKAAAQGVQDGQDVIRQVCWECGLDSGPISKCTSCHAARYCSKECQRKSWKDGHKGACDALKTMYNGFIANCRRIDKAVQLQDMDNCFGPDGGTLPPAGCADYEIIPMFLSNYTFPVVVNVDIIPFTSIDHMYKNLEDIVKGRAHWMFEDTFQDNLKEYVDSHILAPANIFEMEYMLHGMLFLTVDFSKFPVPSGVPFIVSLFRRQLRQVLPDGELMPVARFIEIYYRFGLAEREGDRNPSARLESVTKCMTLMMKYFHKKRSFDLAALQKDAVGWASKPFPHFKGI